MLEKRRIDNLEMELKADLYDMNVIMTELVEMQTRFYSKERTEEQLMKVAAIVYEEWLIWTYGATDMSYLLKTEVRPSPIEKTGEFEELSKIEKAPFILAAKRITEAMERMK